MTQLYFVAYDTEDADCPTAEWFVDMTPEQAERTRLAMEARLEAWQEPRVQAVSVLSQDFASFEAWVVDWEEYK